MKVKREEFRKQRQDIYDLDNEEFYEKEDEILDDDVEMFEYFDIDVDDDEFDEEFGEDEEMEEEEEIEDIVRDFFYQWCRKNLICCKILDYLNLKLFKWNMIMINS